MKIFNIIAIFIYTFLFSVIGGVLIALSLRTASLDSIITSVGYLAHMPNIRMGMALTGFLLILINISIAQLSIGNLQKHKTIAFENPHGQVTLSLSAIEDYIKKITGRLPEIRDVRTNITAGKTGIDITARLALYSDINIPEATDKIQNMIRARLQEMLGIEEKVTIRVHVAKIVQREKAKIDKHESSAIRHAGFKGEIEYGG